MPEQQFKVAGWLDDLYVEFQGIGACGKSIGLGFRYANERGGGVMDYHEVARLYQALGQWLREAEENGGYRGQIDVYNEMSRRAGLPEYVGGAK